MGKEENLRDSGIMEALGRIHADIATVQNDIVWMKENIVRANEKYAAKWVEKMMIGVVSTILFAFVGALVGLVLVKPVYAAIIYTYNFLI